MPSKWFHSSICYSSLALICSSTVPQRCHRVGGAMNTHPISVLIILGIPGIQRISCVLAQHCPIFSTICLVFILDQGAWTRPGRVHCSIWMCFWGQTSVWELCFGPHNVLAVKLGEYIWCQGLNTSNIIVIIERIILYVTDCIGEYVSPEARLVFRRVHEHTTQPWVDIPDGTSL